ncbi:MAG TPA: ergothioneine biosynthesis protein EgtB [Saprospiraceae bacterium]|nr:ergothioneine biosynthesis protein EgtB [Saprospiraceae bacterium]
MDFLNKSAKEIKTAFSDLRKRTEDLCAHIKPEDSVVQPAVFVSPPKWHLGHTSWFFEEFVLKAFGKNYRPYREDYDFLFNSYYNHAGDRVPRDQRGLMTRPTLSEVMDFRNNITEEVLKLLDELDSDHRVYHVLEIGMNHEEQHQELLAYDIKFILGHQVLSPEMETNFKQEKNSSSDGFVAMDEGIYEMGHLGEGFSFDNEHQAHKVFLHSYELSKGLVKNADYLEFIEDGAYENFALWHSDAWDFVNANGLEAPLYWHKPQEEWYHYRLNGWQLIDPNAPVEHISFYEAAAFAEWAGYRLPTEFEWEAASGKFDWGHLWEWTESAYLPYPGFKAAEGALGEYNGKFMVNQKVLRGASYATAPGHSRPTYRNFFHPDMRWHLAGIRLAKKQNL